MSKGVSFDTVDNRKAVGIGNNVFEQGVISVAAGATVKAGTILKRDGAKFAVATGTPPNPGIPASGGGWAADPSPGDILIAVMPFDLANEKAQPADMGFRALVGGLVRKDLLNLNGAAITKAQADALRDYGITAADVTDVSRVNP
jgi:hypothetical protein